MTPAQKRMYWGEWNACKDALLKHGYGHDELEAQRHRIHIEALGADVSSKDLTNEQFDAVLKCFRAYSQPTNLAEQLRLIDQPEKREAAFRDRAHKLVAELGVEEHGREAYLDSMARRVVGRGWGRLGDTEVMRICGILAVQAKRIRAKANA